MHRPFSAIVARGKTIFDDKTNEINALTTQVKQRIATINGKIMSLQQLQRQQNGGGQQVTEHHSNVVLSLQSQLATTSTAFKDVLELRSESLKDSQMLLMQPNQSAYMDGRSEAISSIESTISELGSIFQQLAHMVSEQRDVVQRIDANVESIDANIGAAQTELLKYYASISSNRWLIIKIFAVILAFVFLLVTFV
ncbi:Integral membrane protein SED5 [Coemansia sp. RSA 2711]|nr:Integral membrane protein SED5 [Coemansia sp. RSA 2711]